MLLPLSDFFLRLSTMHCSAFNFDADPDPRSAMDPDPGHLLKIS